MKKSFALLLVFILIAAVGFSAYAEEATEQKKYDYSGFEKYSHYEYDKFDKCWTYYEFYEKDYSDAEIIIGMNIGGYPEGKSQVNTPMLYVKVTDKKENPLYTVKKIDLLIDDVKYSYDKMLETSSQSTVFLGNQGKELVEAIANSNSVSVKLTLEHSDVKFDLDQNQVDSSLKVIAKALIENNVWDYLLEVSNNYEKAFPLTIKR